MALNVIWLGFFFVAFLVGVYKLIFLGDVDVFSRMIASTFEMAKTAFEICLGLTGVLTLWLGIMKIGERGGAVDILALPSFMEGMPYVILEAMAFSLPVIASRVNGIPEAVQDGETAILTPPGDTDALRAALTELMNDASRRQRMGRLGRERFEALFTLQDHIRTMEASYRQLLAVRR